MLPVVRRELQVAARRRATYQGRLIAGAAAMVVALLFVGVGLGTPAEAGETLFIFLSWGALLLCMLEGIRVASDAVARERREGTLGLLFLTDLRGYDVVLGKLSANAVRSFTLLLAVLPVFSLPLLLGGVTAGDTWRVMMTLVVALSFSLSAGLLLSCLFTSAPAAMGGTLLVLVLIAVAPLAVQWLLDGWLFSGPVLLWATGPVGMFLSSSDLTFSSDPAVFRLAALCSIALSVAMLAGASVAVRKVGVEGSGWKMEWIERLLRPPAKRRPRCGHNEGELEPGEWIADRMLPGWRLLWFLVGLGAGICFLAGLFAGGDDAIAILVIVQLSLGFLMKLWLAAIAPHSIFTARQSGALELLLCTPLTSRQYVNGQIKAMIIFFLPGMTAVVVGLPILFGGGATLAGNADLIENAFITISFGMVLGFFFLLDLHALAYAGLWFGLTSVRAEAAMGKTAFAVLLLPWVTMVVPALGCIGLVLWPCFWIGWASTKLTRHFRTKVTQQFTTELKVQ